MSDKKFLVNVVDFEIRDAVTHELIKKGKKAVDDYVSNKNTRIIKRLEDHLWVAIDPKLLMKGDIFKMFEEDGTPVTRVSNEDTEATIFTATSNSYLNLDGIWTVQIG